MSKRVTQKDIAERLGVHAATVSLAFKHHPSIPAKTRERVLKVAEEMGYRPDPMLSALALYRSNNQEQPFRGTLAWLYLQNDDLKPDWKEISTYRQYYEGACRRADQYGYKLDVYNFNTRKVSAQRMGAILKARNINGILLCPMPHPNMELDFPWEDFSVVTFGYTLKKPEFHTVTATQFRSTLRLLEKMYDYGYRRIGYGIASIHDERVGHSFRGAYLTFVHQMGLEPLIFDYKWGFVRGFKTFLRKARPDVVMTGDVAFLKYAREAGIRIPEDIPLTCPVLDSEQSELTGMYEDSFHIGEVAVDKLTNLVMRGDRGIPVKVQRTLIEGVWNEGKTLPDKVTAKR
ncbi:LacI family DNA-binding transcriptional regulator [Ruficoccus sp. ZRK36]|uniref:LacI family DNA-binding transcriptional regulator n=1 Tax=Ruficoccus sp. ZRK36 TaxID=2866311 RepID=UPI001C738518|nr:LacI family DNA-binding transcriptional regulator [Ruficoccus sp. ZRK36]QYY35340.1 LacI family transcriptional regulator [Ruficoccus sp. ZRK36]